MKNEMENYETWYVLEINSFSFAPVQLEVTMFALRCPFANM